MSSPSLFRKAKTTFDLDMTAHCIKCRCKMYPVSNLRHWRKHHR